VPCGTCSHRPDQPLPTQQREAVNRVCPKRRLSTTDELTRERSAYRIILIADIENFNGEHRDDAIRARLRIRLRQLLASALGESGIRDASYTTQSCGDGWLITIDPAVGKPRVLGPVVDRLAGGLRKQNRQSELARQLRVRLVLHAGDLLVAADDELVGAELNFAFRLLDALQLRVLLKQASGPLVMCVSDSVYRQVVAQRHEGLDPAAFEPVWLARKTTRGLGWVRAPGESGLAARAGLLKDQPGRTR
jgi:hypothetical protein